MTERFLIGSDELAARSDVFASPLVFDTNVWLLMQGPFVDHKDKRVKQYSWFYKEALAAGAHIMLPQMVMGEFVNRSIRMRADYAGHPVRSKLQRLTEYADWMSEVADDLFHIRYGADQCDDDFSQLDADHCLGSAGSSGMDFNDVLLSMLCQRQRFHLVTDDADFSGQPILLITANPKLA